jgi:hypothetical protein
MNQEPPATDANGKVISVGSLVLIRKIPVWLTHDLPVEDVERLKAVEGTLMRVAEIDRFGYVWLAADDVSTGWFCLKPNEVEAE